MKATPTFVTTRARVLRKGASHHIWGWIQYLGPGLAKVRLQDNPALEIRESLAVEVQGPDRLGTFEAEVVSHEGGETLLRITGDIRYTTMTDPPRVAVQEIYARVRIGESEAVAEVVDASPRGAGLLVSVPLPVGITVQVELRHASQGNVSVKGETRYCQENSAKPGQYRVGIQLDASDRVAMARWAQAIEGNRRGAPERRTA